MAANKTIKLKRPPTSEPAPPEPAEAATQAAPEPEAPAAAVAAPAGLEPTAAAGPKVSSKSYMVFALLSIAATLFCLAVIGMQAAEWSFYKADPSVWPVK